MAKKKDLKLPKRIEVIWHDPKNYAVWNPVNAQFEPAVCASIGWVLHDDDQYLTLCHTLGDPDFDVEKAVLGVLVIPKGCVKSRRYLK